MRHFIFAKREGFGGKVILNLYAFRTKYTKVMLAAGDPVGLDNDRIVARATGTVVAGWGANDAPARVAGALALLPRLHVLGTTKDGHPGHPLCVRADAPLAEWAPGLSSDQGEDSAASVADALPSGAASDPQIAVQNDPSDRQKTRDSAAPSGSIA
ncbi:DUF1643 domain-containing protein [Herbiconiux sp. 11R-BC]|uniref:DUF1643 domain-containing protein n=1 Tax=Herbiconiux sp. 11R-BC TaxID=3111637 RepID=UPI003C0ABB2B